MLKSLARFLSYVLLGVFAIAFTLGDSDVDTGEGLTVAYETHSLGTQDVTLPSDVDCDFDFDYDYDFDFDFDDDADSGFDVSV